MKEIKALANQLREMLQKELDKKKSKSNFCKNHDYVISDVKTKGLREGTMMVDLLCKKCGSKITTFHDLTETEDISYRNPGVEGLLLKQGYIEKKNGKMFIKCLE